MANVSSRETDYSQRLATRLAYHKSRSDTILTNLDDVYHAAGIFSKSEIEGLKRDKFLKLMTVADPYNFIDKTYEVCFYTKFDLHILGGKDSVSSNNKTINPDLKNNTFFEDLIERYPEVVNQLQLSANLNNGSGLYKNPFMNLLSLFSSSSMDLPSVSSEIIETSENAYGTSINYRSTGEASDDNHSFSIEYKDGPDLQVYMFFKAYEMYERMKSHGDVAPFKKYIKKSILHDQCSIYKFTLASDRSTIIHYAKAWGAFPKTVPRDAFSNPFDGGLTFNIDWQAAFVDDMDPNILSDFNALTQDRWNLFAKRSTDFKNASEVKSSDLLYGIDTGMVYSKEGDFMLNEILNVPYIVYSSNDNHYHLVWR